MLRMLLTLGVLAVAMATRDDVIARNYDATPRDVYPGLGEYFFVGVAVNWTQAVVGCQVSAAHLAVIDSDAEAVAIQEMMLKYGPEYIHLGFHDQWEEGRYINVLGQSIDAACNGGAHWAPGAPSGDTDHNCGGYDVEGFRDIQCSEIRQFFCELNKADEGEMPGYIVVPDFGLYKYYAEPAVWTAGDEQCRKDGANLWVAHSQAEIDAMKFQFDLIAPFSLLTSVHRFFGDNDNFLTVTGVSLTDLEYQTFYANEPSGTFLTHPFTEYHEEGLLKGLRTIDSSSARPFICERDILG